MIDPAVGLVVAFVVVAVVLFGVGTLAWYGQRAAFRPAGPRSIRRMAFVTGAFAFLGLGAAIGGAAAGTGISWLLIIQSVVLLAMAGGWLRDERVRDGHERWNQSTTTERPLS